MVIDLLLGFVQGQTPVFPRILGHEAGGYASLSLSLSFSVTVLLITSEILDHLFSSNIIIVNPDFLVGLGS